MSDYSVTAQFYDAIATQQQVSVAREIATALEGLQPAGCPIVDIGAGTGLTTQVIAAALPEAEIIAVEPDAAMRAALMTRVCADPDLRRRVSILPASVLSAPLPPVLSAAVAGASLVHFDAHQRAQLWALLGARLAPTGRAVLEIQCPAAQDLAEARIASSDVGQVTYEAWAGAQRLDDHRQRWRITYVARLHGAELDRQSTDYICWTLSAAQLLAEARGAGLVGEATGQLVVLRKQPVEEGWSR